MSFFLCLFVILYFNEFSLQSRFCSNLQLSAKVQKAATAIAKKAVDLDLVSGWVADGIMKV